MSSSNLDDEESPLSDNFLLYIYSDSVIKQIQKEKNGLYEIRGKLSDITILLTYNCPDSNCTIRPEDQKEYYNYKIQWEVVKNIY